MNTFWVFMSGEMFGAIVTLIVLALIRISDRDD